MYNFLLFENDSLFNFFVLLISATYACFLYTMLNKTVEKNKKKTEIFFKTVLTGLKHNFIINAKDINNTYKGIWGISCDEKDSTHCGKICKLLQQLLVGVLNNKNCVKDLNLSTEQRAYIKEKISDFIEYFETKYPYANLPIAEMNILNDISTYALNKDFESVSRKLNELTGVLQVRNEDYIKIEKMNKWSIPISIIGFILTLIFGIISIVK